MPSAFLSYSREDLALIEQLEARLKASSPNISIWRDQEKIYGGQKWPKVLGEAIAHQDVFLLAWSKNSVASHFVEFEWCTALALKKTIVPCLLDSTALPPSLTATNAVAINDDPSKLVTALTGAHPVTDVVRRAEIRNKLDQITDTEPREVLKAAKTLFDQRGWTVQGNVIQGECVTVHMGEGAAPAAKGLAEKWQTWVGTLVGILTAVTLMSELPAKIKPVPPPPSGPTTPKIESNKPKLQTLVGAIRTAGDDPLDGVQVSLPQFNLTTTTDKFGQFRFRVMTSEQETVALLAQKPGYQPYEADVTLGNPALGFTMRKKP